MAGGFMKGFGPAFSNAFNAGVERQAVKQRDAFQVAYDNFSKNKAAYATQDAMWSKSLKQAEAIVASVGANVPKEAIPKVAEYIMAGASDKTITDLLEQNSFEVQDMEPAAPDETQSVDQQMEASGLAPPDQGDVAPTFASPENVNEQPENPALSAIQSVFPNVGNSREERAANEVMEQTGTTEEEFNKINAGWVPPDTSSIIITPLNLDEMENATFEPKDNIIAIVPEVGAVPIVGYTATEVITVGGQRYPRSQARITSKELLDQEQQLMSQISDDGRAIVENGSLAKSTVGTIYKLDGMVVEDERVITQVGNAAGNLQGLFNEAGVLFDMTAELTAEDAKKLEDAAIRMGENALGETAGNVQLFNSVAWGLVFQVARADQGSGQLSGRDVEQAARRVFASNDPIKFRENLQNLARGLRDKWNTAADDFEASEGNIELLLQQFPDRKEFIQDMFGPMEAKIDTEISTWMDGEISDNPNENATPAPEGLDQLGWTEEEFNALDPEDQQSIMDILNGSN